MKSAGLRPDFRTFLREMASKSRDSVAVWKQAKTPSEKQTAQKVIVQNARAKAQLRDEIAGFLRSLSLDQTKQVHRFVMDLNTANVLLDMVKPKRSPSPRGTARRSRK